MPLPKEVSYTTINIKKNLGLSGRMEFSKNKSSFSQSFKSKGFHEANIKTHMLDASFKNNSFGGLQLYLRRESTKSFYYELCKVFVISIVRIPLEECLYNNNYATYSFNIIEKNG